MNEMQMSSEWPNTIDSDRDSHVIMGVRIAAMEGVIDINLVPRNMHPQKTIQ